MNINFYFSGGKIPISGIAGGSVCLVFERLPNAFPEGLYYFAFSPAVYK